MSLEAKYFKRVPLWNERKAYRILACGIEVTEECLHTSLAQQVKYLLHKIIFVLLIQVSFDQGAT